VKRGFRFVHDKLEIKILVLFILRRLPEPVTFDELVDLLMCYDGISYFECAECLAELIETGHLLINADKYILTKKGARNGEITENNLPDGVREKAERISSSFRAVQSRNSMIKASHSKEQDGSCKVSLSLSDGIGNIVSLELYATNEKQARSLEKGFRANAETVYNKLIEAILA